MKMSPQQCVANSIDLQSTRSGPVTRPAEKKKMKSIVPRRKPIKAFSKTRQSDEYEACHVSKNAVLLMEAHVHLTTGLQSRERLLLLFTDSLIIAKTKSLYLKLKVCVCLSDIWLGSCIYLITERKHTSKNSFVIGWPTTNYVVTFSSSETKERWLHALQWHTCRLRQRILPNAILLYVLLICHPNDNCPTTVAVAVDVSTTADNVVQYIMQQCKLLGEVSDYQLYVNYEKEEETIPLFGHELPFFILHHSLRSQQDHLHMPSVHLHEAFSASQQTEATPKTPHFTLKTRIHLPRGAVLKHKRKRSLIDWALRRGHPIQSKSHTDSHTASHKLFGQSLSSICHDGNLPKPIMDLLYLLFCEGPETCGIFRRSANAKNCRILKEQINSGQSLSLHEESVFVSASLITEFLRKLPGGVLRCDLYEDWMEVLQSDDQQDRLNRVRSLLAQLPKENVTLLCHLFGVLHRIHSYSQVNQMTATNLALCIAPNMLWRSCQISPEQEGQNALQIAVLIQFLIENTPAIFGNDLESLFDKQINSGQETNDFTDASYLHQHSSSDDTDQDFITSPPLSPEVHPLFFPLAALSLKEKRPRTFHTSKPSSEGTYSCGTLYSISSHPSASVSMLGVGELSQSHDRCLSEPSMYFFTPNTQETTHPPVIRQSSYDAVLTKSRNEQSQGSMRLSPEQQTHNSGIGTRRRRYTFWKSPQIPSRFRHPAQRLASMSSLSSTTTSSLSSLDSTLSLNSADPIPSPRDTQSRHFLFGAAARLRPLTPEMARKRWTNTFTYEEEQKVEIWNESDQETENEIERGFKGSFNDCGGERIEKNEERPEREDNTSCESFSNIHEVKGIQRQCVSECLTENVCSMGFNPLMSSDAYKKEPDSDLNSLAISQNPSSVWTVPQAKQIGNEIQASEVTQILIKTPTAMQKQISTKLKNSVGQLQLERTNTRSNMHISVGQKMSRMKITFFPSSGRVMLKHSKVTNQTDDITKSIPVEREQEMEPGSFVQKGGKQGDPVQEHVQEKLFYIHKVPQVLHSTSPQQTSVQVQKHCTSPKDVGVADPGLSGGGDVSVVTLDRSNINGVSCYPEESFVQCVKCIHLDKGVSHSASNFDDLHRPGSGPDTAGPAFSVSSGYSVNRGFKLFHGHSKQSSPKAVGKFSETFRETICINLPVNVCSRGPAENKQLP
ncbi:rho GTPase-activating protein 20-like [Xyrauchen texanus]|uniref:rho GTPase-activating protein 20-like n=1 Tax=Xyrauchen texanus TaxID=154827 RepID=UPI0022426E8D|nr:rho GTPase-activating protein 20-like [Xyrauchen texanus]